MNEMSENAGLISLALDLPQNDIGSTERRSDGREIALLACDSQLTGVADHSILPVAFRGQIHNQHVGDGITELRHCWIASLVIEARNRNDRSLLCRVPARYPITGCKQGREHKTSCKDE